MLTSVKMEVHDGLLRYPDELKEPLMETPDLVLRDGTRVTPAEIWRFMTEEAPRRLPYLFTSNPGVWEGMPRYVEMISSIKYFYLEASRRSRIDSLRKSGMPLVFVQGGQNVDLYHAAGAVPQRPRNMSELTISKVGEGLDVRARDVKMLSISEDAKRLISMEACHQGITHAAIQRGVLQVDMLAPHTCLRCSDVTFLVETHRDSDIKVPSYLMDYPRNDGLRDPWVVDYLAKNLRRLVAEIDAVSGRHTTQEDIRATARTMNEIRKTARDFVELWWAAPVQPTYSSLVRWVTNLVNDESGDPGATLQVLEELCSEVKERVRHGLKGEEVQQCPVRVFTCGSCFIPYPYFLDRLGAMWLGGDDRLSNISIQVEEDGDIYEKYARALLAAPYELPSEQRALWIVEQIKRSRAHGVIFGYHWGCNFQSAVTRMMCDIVEKEGHVSVTTLYLDDLGRSEPIEQTNTRVAAFVEMLIEAQAA